VQDAQKNWNTIDTVDPRDNWATEIIDMSEHLPDAHGSLKVRLFFTANHKLDFVGLDTSSQAEIQVSEAEFISAVHSKSGEDTRTKLLIADQLCARLLPGQQIDLQFRLPAQTEESRDILLVGKGHYVAITSSPDDLPLPPDPPVPKWREWFDLISKNCREKGWIWANVVGNPFKYVSNTNKYPQDPVEIGIDGLKRYLKKDIVLNYRLGNTANRIYNLDKQGFRRTYPSLPKAVIAYKTFSEDADVPWDAFDYVDPTDGSYATVAITMNATVMNARTYPGIFVHNGVSNDVDGNGVANEAQDDWLKGYIATALAIEEARSLISWPTVLTEVLYNTHAAAFAVAIAAGDWGSDHDPRGPYSYYYYLSQADFEISGGPGTYYLYIDSSRSGIDTGDRDVTLMHEIGWWNLGTLAGSVPAYGLILGPAIGTIPIVINYFQPPSYDPEDENHVWAKEISVDPNNDDRGTASIAMEIRFYGTEGQGSDTDYTFNVNMASWKGDIATEWGTGRQTVAPRVDDISYSTTVTFTVRWGIT
jgi:hypothetical protein